MHLTNSFNNVDLPMWSHTTNGIFTTKSVYPLISSYTKTASNSEFKWIWKLKNWNKIKYFLWQCHHDRLPTKSYLCHIGIDTSLYYSVCSTTEKTPQHIFLFCPIATHLWEELGVNTQTLDTQSIHYLDSLYKHKL